MKKEKNEIQNIDANSKEIAKIEDESPQKKRKVYLKKITYIMLSVFLVLLISLFVYIYSLYSKLGDLEFKGEMQTNQLIELPEDTDDVEGLPDFIPSTPSPTAEETPSITATPSPTPDPDGITNILIIGCDSKKMHSYDNARSDVNMVLTIDEVNNEIKLSSYTRDILVFYDHLNNGDGGYNRLNAALQYYNHPDGVVKIMEENFRLDIDYYMITDYWGVEKLVNALGGVRVYLTDAETHAVNDVIARYNYTYDHPTDQNFVAHGAGVKFLNGRQAVCFMRVRKIDSDFGRIERQHEVLDALKEKISDMDIVDVIKIIDKMPDMIYTDMSQEEIIKYTKILYSMKDVEMQYATVPFDGTWKFARYNGMSIIQVDLDKNNEQLVEFIYK
ncbi:MAG: LCP family protein [Eubacteriales bacterium]